jgi:hypothetical protein
MKGIVSDLSVKYQQEDEGVFVYYKGKCVYHIPDHELPDEVLDGDDNVYLLDYVVENYGVDIYECIEAYEWKPSK